jgi:hypothetical protein
VKPLAAVTAEFAGVPASIPAATALPAFTITYRDRFRNLSDYGGSVLYRNTSNATVMGSITTTATSVGVVTSAPLTFASVGNFALSVSGLLAANVSGNRGFVVVPVEPEEKCGTTFSIDNLTTQELERKQILDDITAQLMLDPPEMQEANNTTPIVIPVVVHVLRTPGMPLISDFDIRNQIDILNQDYNRLNADRVNTPPYFAQFATSANIRFCLAQTDPNGIFTTGIMRYDTEERGGWGSAAGLRTGSDRNALRPKILAPGWNPARYLNIWVTNLRYVSPEDASLGYANPPHYERAGFATSANVNVVVDGVVVNYRAFGTNTNYVIPKYSLGRTLTHEVGHWMNLLHIWGNFNNQLCGDDGVVDTPPQTGSTALLCPNFPNLNTSNTTCYPFATIHGNMFMNYMDYTDDACMNMFSKGQAIRMRDIFTIPDNLGGRRDILASSTIACVPGFIPLQVFLDAEMNELMPGASTLVTANSIGTNPAITYIWEFRELSTTNQWSQWFPFNQGTLTTRTVSMPANVAILQIKVTATNANGERVTFSIIIRNLSTGFPRALRMQNLTQPSRLSLVAAPNPVSDNLTISYQLFEESIVTLEITNSLQQRVALLLDNARIQAGTQSLNVNVRNLPNGVYILRAIAADTKTHNHNIEQKTIQIHILK